MAPVFQPSITVSLSGAALLVILMAIGGYSGYQQGLRNILTIALWTILAYLLTVQGGTFLVDVINRFWSNGPRLVGFLIGQNVNEIAPLEPLISPNLQIPLFFRVLAFIALTMLGFFFNKKAAWKGPPKEPLARPLGLFVGALIALLWSNAAVVFWNQYQATGGILGGPIASFLNTLPNISEYMPSLIAVFFLILFVLMLFNFPKVWKP
ncbi:MAG: hypothetical protein HC822_13270 [Oscillochloris sp.]|nr:hypothetical protein [Oscillochloris sp.]